MKHLAKVIMIASIGSLNAFAIFSTCAHFSGNFGQDKQQVEKHVKSFEIKLNTESETLAAN